MTRKVYAVLAPLLLLVLVAASFLPGEAAQPAAAAQACTTSEEIPDFPRFARLKHDYQWMGYPSRMAEPGWSWGGGNQADWYPETVPLTTGPNSGDGSIQYTKAWLQFLRKLQPNDNAAVWITTLAYGLFNRQPNEEKIPILDLDELEEKPVAEGISTGGNVVMVLEVKNGGARLEMLTLKGGPPGTGKVNYQLTPWLISKFTSISTSGEIGNANGLDVYFPLIAKNAKGNWVQVKRIEWFPSLPRCVTPKGSLSILSAPNGLNKNVGSLGAGQTATLLEYMPQGSSVWGRIEQGWILLEYLDRAGQPVYTTDWSMQTRPPILFPQ